MRHATVAVRKVNFQFERGRSTRAIAITLALAGALAAAVVLYEYFDAVQRVSALQVKVSELRRMSQRVPGVIDAATRDPAELRQEIRLANGVLQQIALPWDGLFRELERSRDSSVALLSIHPDLQSRMVRIGGEARNLRAVVDYARRLDAAGALHDVHIVSHEVKVDDPRRPVTFSLVAGWR